MLFIEEDAVIKGLECCSLNDCVTCPYQRYKHDFAGDCTSELAESALNIIKKLKNKYDIQTQP